MIDEGSGRGMGGDGRESDTKGGDVAERIRGGWRLA